MSYVQSVGRQTENILQWKFYICCDEDVNFKTDYISLKTNWVMPT